MHEFSPVPCQRSLEKKWVFFKVNSQLTLLRGKTTELVYGISWLQSPSGSHNVVSDFFSHTYSIIRVFFIPLSGLYEVQ